MSNNTASLGSWLDRHELFSRVGQGISFWASMETHLVTIAAILLDTTERKAGLVLYSIPNFYSWLNIIDDLFAIEQPFATHRPKWTKATSIMRELNDTRVRLAHHTIYHRVEGPDVSLRPSEFDSRSKARSHAPLDKAQVSAFCDAVLKLEGEYLIPLARSMAIKSASLGRTAFLEICDEQPSGPLPRDAP